jgi:DHA1 family bicyclomycin/chloramphenicol resistance-like MFS transporter
MLYAVALVPMTMILAASPSIYAAEFGVVGVAFALLFSLHGVGIVIGQTANHRLIGTIGPVRAALVAIAVMICAGVWIAATAWSGSHSAITMTFGLFVYAIGFLIVASNATGLTMDPHGDIAGFTASFHGFFCQVSASLVASLLTYYVAGDAVKFASVILVVAAICGLALIWWDRTDAVSHSTTG